MFPAAQNSAEGKVALITGAGRGIGRALALRLGESGFKLALAARSAEELAETRRLSGLAPADSLIVLLDLAQNDAAQALLQTTVERYGRIDVLVNNAGWAPARQPLVKTSESDVDRILAVNLRAPIALARLAAIQMIAQGAGTIVNIASAAGRQPRGGEAVYAAAKAGLIAFSHACFEEWRKHGVRVAVVLPGLVDTALVPPNKRLNRSAMLRPDQVATAVAQIIASPPGLWPLEVTVLPQHDPLA
ncbi:MAG TPA: SDR family oxidoreductase [Candidatus Binataceae bacterium]|nr:SDR family oxidoreductase [Candidatus Binataceae bacterium]